MDGERFDVLARSLTHSGSRRAALRVLTAGVVAVALNRGRIEETLAACRGVGASCRSTTQCCRGSHCTNHACRCKEGLTRCGKRCRNTASDPDNCGGCGLSCSQKTCRAGRCVCRRQADCATGQLCAGRVCVTGAGMCLAGADICAGASFGCGAIDTCSCFQTTEGTTRCGIVGASTCGSCTSSADCDEHGPGAFCIPGAGNQGAEFPCTCPVGQGVCGAPCARSAAATAAAASDR